MRRSSLVWLIAMGARLVILVIEIEYQAMKFGRLVKSPCRRMKVRDITALALTSIRAVSGRHVFEAQWEQA